MPQDRHKASFLDIERDSPQRMVNLVLIFFLIVSDIIKNQIYRFNNTQSQPFPPDSVRIFLAFPALTGERVTVHESLAGVFGIPEF